MENFFNSIKFIKQSSVFLFRNMDLLLLTLLLFCTLTTFLFFIKNIIISTDMIVLPIILVIAAYLSSCILITYYEAILVAIIIKRLNAQKMNALSAIYNSRRYLFSVFRWGLILSSLGMMDKFFRYIWPPRLFFDFFKQRYYSKSLWWLRSGNSWNFASYFVLPFLVEENVSLTSACKQSDSLFGPGWQKNFRISPLIGLFCFITICIYFYCLNNISPAEMPTSTRAYFIC